MDQPPLGEGGVVGEPGSRRSARRSLYEADLPACCLRSARGSGDVFECPSCGAVWQAPVPLEPEVDAFLRTEEEERKGAA